MTNSTTPDSPKCPTCSSDRRNIPFQIPRQQPIPIGEYGTTYCRDPFHTSLPTGEPTNDVDASWPGCEACQSYHHSKNPSCELRAAHPGETRAGEQEGSTASDMFKCATCKRLQGRSYACVICGGTLYNVSPEAAPVQTGEGSTPSQIPEFWAYLEQNYKEVANWPGWMRHGIVILPTATSEAFAAHVEEAHKAGCECHMCILARKLKKRREINKAERDSWREQFLTEASAVEEFREANKILGKRTDELRKRSEDLAAQLKAAQQERERLTVDKEFYSRTKGEWKGRAEAAETLVGAIIELDELATGKDLPLWMAAPFQKLARRAEELTSKQKGKA